MVINRAGLIARSLRHDGTGFISTYWRARKVRGWLGATDARNLYALARSGPGKGAIVEIGAAYGRSTCFLASGSKCARREPVVSIDPHTGDVFACDYVPGSSSLPEFTSNIRAMGVEEYVRPVVATSEVAAEEDHGPIRLLFVDGMHTYEAVSLDIELWASRVVRDGVIVFDDFWWPELTQAIDEFRARVKTRVLSGTRNHLALQIV